MEVNGKDYPLWSQFVERKEEWIGGILEELQDSFPQGVGKASQTEITDITLTPNGDDSAKFNVEGKDYGCGFGVEYGGVVGGEDGWITFSGYGGHLWRIQQRVLLVGGKSERN